MAPPTLIALLHGPDQPGLVARVAGWIFTRGGNMLHADQHRDPEAGVLFQRVEWVPAAGPDAAAAAEFTAFAASLGMQARLVSTARRQRVVLFVSKADHCFHDLVLRGRAGELPGDLVAVVGNHPDLAAAAAGYGLPFHHVPVTPETKAAAENRQLELLRAAGTSSGWCWPKPCVGTSGAASSPTATRPWSSTSPAFSGIYTAAGLCLARPLSPFPRAYDHARLPRPEPACR